MEIKRTKKELQKIKRSIKKGLSTNLNRTYKEEQKKKLWLCIKEFADTAWKCKDDGNFDIWKNIFCNDKDIDKILLKNKKTIRDGLKFFNINKTVLDFLGEVICDYGLNRNEIEKELCEKYKKYWVEKRVNKK